LAIGRVGLLCASDEREQAAHARHTLNATNNNAMRNGTEGLASNESGIDAPDYMATGKPSQKAHVL
jgi:hypothetical protein